MVPGRGVSLIFIETKRTKASRRRGTTYSASGDSRGDWVAGGLRCDGRDEEEGHCDEDGGGLHSDWKRKRLFFEWFKCS
jgi:hypothetical protein